MSPGAGWLILMNGRPESGSMSRAIFSLLTFQGSSASYLFILHDLISVAGDDESTMNPRLRLCTELPRLVSLLKFACPRRPGIGCWDRMIGSIVLQVYCGRRHRYDGDEGAQLPTTPRRHLARGSRARRQLLPPSSGETRSLLPQRTGGGSLRPFR